MNRVENDGSKIKEMKFEITLDGRRLKNLITDSKYS